MTCVANATTATEVEDCEIEVTSEMIAAGFDVIDEGLEWGLPHATIAKEVYIAMARLAPVAGSHCRCSFNRKI